MFFLELPYLALPAWKLQMSKTRLAENVGIFAGEIFNGFPK